MYKIEYLTTLRENVLKWKHRNVGLVREVSLSTQQRSVPYVENNAETAITSNT